MIATFSPENFEVEKVGGGGCFLLHTVNDRLSGG